MTELRCVTGVVADIPATMVLYAGIAEMVAWFATEALCESTIPAIRRHTLGEEMLQLLKQSNGQVSPKDIFAGSVPQRTGEELVHFAISEGLLRPVVHATT